MSDEAPLNSKIQTNSRLTESPHHSSPHHLISCFAFSGFSFLNFLNFLI